MPYTIHDHTELKRVSSIAAAPDGTWLAVAVQRLDRDGTKYVSDLWRVPADGSPASQLTRGESKDVQPGFRRDGALAFLSNRHSSDLKPDEDADKRMQIWILPMGGGEPYPLTDEPLGVEAFRFARQGNRLLYTAPVLPDVPHDKQRETFAERTRKGSSARRFTQQPVRHWDHWLHENPELDNTHLIACQEDGTSRIDLTPNATRELSIEPAFDLSEDGANAVLGWQTPGQDREIDTTLLLIDIETKRERRLGAHPNVNNDSAHFSPDGKRLAFLRSFRSPQTAVRPQLTLHDLASGAERTIAAEWDRWPEIQCWTLDGSAIIATADDKGYTPVFSIDVATGEVTRLTAPESGGTHTDVHVLNHENLACIRSTLVDAPECVSFPVSAQTQPKALARLSGFTPAAWATVENCTTPSTDGTPIQYFFLKPHDATGPLPTLLWIHGGPIGMDQDGWHWRWNPLLAVAQGYAVVLPNPRGSTGFGQDFIQGIWGNVWGGQCYQDLMSVTDALERRPDVDAQRVMAMGGSFGGYMTNWIGTQTHRFRCLITHASIFTMAQFTGVTDHPAWWYLEMGGEDPYANPESFDRYAPVRHVKNWKTPTLIIHGELDYRCPISEGLNLFEALQYHGTASELLIFPDEGHWILKPKNSIAWYNAVFDFLDRHMKAK